MELLKSWLFLALNLVISIFKRAFRRSEKDRFVRNFIEEGLIPLSPEITKSIKNYSECMVCGYCDMKGEFSLLPHLTKNLPDYPHFLKEFETVDLSNFFCPFGVKPDMMKDAFKSA